MDSNNQNNDEARSKIEKIRIDLEKKLAALEAAKLKSINEIEKEEIVEDTASEEIVSEEISKDTIIVSDEFNKISYENNQSFIEQITNIENSSTIDVDETEGVEKTIESDFEKKPDLIKEVVNEPISEANVIVEEVEVENNISTEDTFFEISDPIEDVSAKEVEIEEEIIEDVLVAPTLKPKEDIENDKVVVKQEKITDKSEVKKTIAATTALESIDKNTIVENTTEVKEKEEKSKSNSLTYLIYALGGLVFLAVLYLSWGFFNNKKSNKDNRIISEYENRRFKDSIELADANNLLLDFQSQRYIDSIAIANQIQLDNNSSKYKNKATNFNKTNYRARNEKNARLESVTAPAVKRNNSNNNSFIGEKDVASNDTTLINANQNTQGTNNNDNIVDASKKENETPIGNGSVEEKTEETKNDDKVADVKEVKKVEKPKTETLSTIEKAPIFPGCESKATELLKKRCLMSNISKFVSKRFNSDLSQDLGLGEGRKRINVSFVIDKSGGVTVLKVRGQHKVLEKEALRVVESLPRMKPGRKNGKAEPVIYNLPIIYKVEY